MNFDFALEIKYIFTTKNCVLFNEVCTSEIL